MGGDTFTRQYAIRMPSGELFSHKAAATLSPADDYSIPSPMRDMAVMFGLSAADLKKAQQPAGPVIFDSAAAAEKKLAELRTQAAAVGVSNYGGEVVHRLCAPFTTGRAAQQFLTDLQSWLESQPHEGNS